MCAGHTEEHSDLTAGVIGSLLAAWTIRSHVVQILQAFPADDEGFFEGRYLTFYRLLRPLAVPVQQIQRSLRGVRSAECLLSLRRAINASLAVENSAGRFAMGPGPKVELADFGAD